MKPVGEKRRRRNHLEIGRLLIGSLWWWEGLQLLLLDDDPLRGGDGGRSFLPATKPVV